jgi:hypothetical protein
MLKKGEVEGRRQGMASQRVHHPNPNPSPTHLLTLTPTPPTS